MQSHKIARGPYERRWVVTETGVYQLDLSNMTFPKTLTLS